MEDILIKRERKITETVFNTDLLRVGDKVNVQRCNRIGDYNTKIVKITPSYILIWDDYYIGEHAWIEVKDVEYGRVKITKGWKEGFYTVIDDKIILEHKHDKEG
jgi:hypothetical protein